MKMECAVYVLTLITAILIPLRIDGIDANWYLILSWPLVVVVLWSMAAIGLTVLLFNWIHALSHGGSLQELDAVLWEILPSYSPQARWKAIGIVSVFVATVDLIVVCAFISLTQLVRVLQGNASSLGFIFVPLIISCMALLSLSISAEWLLTGSRSVSNETSTNRGCVTCRHIVDRVVVLGSSDALVVDNHCEREENETCTICMMQPADSVFLPCGHGGVCFSCAQQWCFGIAVACKKDPESTTTLYLAKQSATFFKISK